ALRQHQVIVDIAEREKMILTQLEELEKQLKGTIISREEVMPQVVNLVEWPFLTYAEFVLAYLKAPKEVLISEMVEYRKYFSVLNKDVTLKNQFIITANMPPTEVIRTGNQQALSPRLNDGVFLFEQGMKVKLEQYNEKLKSITFQKDLG